MMFELKVEEFESVHHLFQEVDYSLSILAALGNTDQALIYLNEAVDHSWKHAEWTNQVEQFEFMRGIPEMEVVLARMEAE